MLVLSRHKDETIEIAGGEITITVVDVRGDKVRLGITAPRDIDVHRFEVAEAIRREEKNHEENKNEEPDTTRGPKGDQPSDVASGGTRGQQPLPRAGSDPTECSSGSDSSELKR